MSDVDRYFLLSGVSVLRGRWSFPSTMLHMHAFVDLYYTRRKTCI